QESAGIVASEDSARFLKHLARGLVADVFTADVLAHLTGPRAIGHVRYSTAGGTNVQNAQPLTVETMRGTLAVAHNGNFVNATQLRSDLERDGAIFSTHGDTEVIVHLMARSRAIRLQDRLREALAAVQGAYTLLVMQGDSIVGLRDPQGFRPLVLG